MIIQNIIFPDEACPEEALYFCTGGEIKNNERIVFLKAGQTLSSETYMNAFDIGWWRKYTVLRNISLRLSLCGEGKVWLCRILRGETEFLEEKSFKNEEIIFSLSEIKEGLIFFKVSAETKVIFRKGFYYEKSGALRDVRLAVNTVTFHRNAQLKKNLDKFKKSQFFQRGHSLYGRLKVYVTDNGDDFKYEDSSGFINICSNSNRGGGSGGFERGLEEIKKEWKNFPASHVVFMDDDVEFQMESFYRLFAFYSYVTKEYEAFPTAGRMFCLDNRALQYTAAEKWNKGELIHLEGNLDMSLKENLKEEKNMAGDYGGWWLCAYPAGFALKNKPYPFFLHCDDAEYGLRSGKKAFILRGFQVWHETAASKANLKAVYYDSRNSFILNTMEGGSADSREVLGLWKKKLDFYHNQGMYKEKYYYALGLWDAAEPKRFKKNFGEISQSVLKTENEKIFKAAAALLHRAAEKKTEKNFSRIKKSYLFLRSTRKWQ